MTTHGGGMVKEAGIALAIAAIYILTLLLPLHQAAGLQRELATFGYETISKVSICNPTRTDAPKADDGLVFKCPAAGIAKNPFADAPAGSEFNQPRAVGTLEMRGESASPSLARLNLRDGLSRAPPSA
ncbi:MAG: hypothetical protein ACO1O4_16045 [Devosia sp.]